MPNSGRHDAQTLQPKAGAVVSDIADGTCADALLPGEEHQYIATVRCAADSTPLDFKGRRLKDFPERGHAGGYRRKTTTKPFTTSKTAITNRRKMGAPSGIA
jgi:hypothetical protein